MTRTPSSCYFQPTPSACDVCKSPFEQTLGEFMFDMPSNPRFPLSLWGCFCVDCVNEANPAPDYTFSFGFGQIYQWDGDGFVQVYGGSVTPTITWANFKRLTPTTETEETPQSHDGNVPDLDPEFFLRQSLGRLEDHTIEILYNLAKHRDKGLHPFFKDPRSMIALRKEHAKRFGAATA